MYHATGSQLGLTLRRAARCRAVHSAHVLSQSHLAATRLPGSAITYNAWCDWRTFTVWYRCWVTALAARQQLCPPFLLGWHRALGPHKGGVHSVPGCAVQADEALGVGDRVRGRQDLPPGEPQVGGGGWGVAGAGHGRPAGWWLALVKGRGKLMGTRAGWVVAAMGRRVAQGAGGGVAKGRAGGRAGGYAAGERGWSADAMELGRGRASRGRRGGGQGKGEGGGVRAGASCGRAREEHAARAGLWGGWRVCGPGAGGWAATNRRVQCEASTCALAWAAADIRPHIAGRGRPRRAHSSWVHGSQVRAAGWGTRHAAGTVCVEGHRL